MCCEAYLRTSLLLQYLLHYLSSYLILVNSRCSDVLYSFDNFVSVVS